LVRSDPAPDTASLEALYCQSHFTYSAETAELQATYGSYLRRLEPYGANKETLLEVGCGNGFFLQEALSCGYTRVLGIELSRSAIEQASPEVRALIRCGPMRRGAFSPGEFDAVCLFQVMDHFPDPGEVLDACREALRPGGLVLALNHNVEAVSAHLLGERSPIFDIEHTYLYSPRTMARLFENHGFRVLETKLAINRFQLRYLVHLAPLPAGLKAFASSLLKKLGLAHLRLSLPLGNMFLIARKEGR
jgi:SAM-dependent methyltransferase